MTEDAHTIVFAGGGSGGHISPGLAIAERLREMAPEIAVHFVCSERAIDRAMLTEAGATFTPVPAVPPSVRPAAAWRFVRRHVESRRRIGDLLARHRVGGMLALGGFISVSAVAAARKGGVPVALLNLDDPPGKANRWVARRCAPVWTAIEVTSASGFADRVVGVPVRQCALAGSRDAAECRRALDLAPDRPTLLVTGASQGATSINRLLEHLAQHRADLLRGWQLIHLAGTGNVSATETAYAAAGWSARVVPFVHEMGLAWGAADLAISRAGANSVAEVEANAVPTIFLPYPYHRDQHQRRNAAPLVDRDAARVVDDAVDPSINAERIAPVLELLLDDAGLRARLRARLRENRGPDAASQLAELLLDRLCPRTAPA